MTLPQTAKTRNPQLLLVSCDLVLTKMAERDWKTQERKRVGQLRRNPHSSLGTIISLHIL